jgi:hypothetical protein
MVSLWRDLLSSANMDARSFFPQRRQGAKKSVRNAVALCAFAFLREIFLR